MRAAPPAPPEALRGLPVLAMQEREGKGEESGSILRGPWAGVCFTVHKKGVFCIGGQKPGDFIRDNREQLLGLGLSDSGVNTIAAVSANEGRLDAVNTWDKCFLSFGMFQWTLGGRGSERGTGRPSGENQGKRDPRSLIPISGDMGSAALPLTGFSGILP